MRIDRYRKNLNLRKSGKYPGIPLFNIYPKLGRYIPSLPREITIAHFGSTGSGKTQWHKRFCLNIALAHYTKKINTKPLFMLNLLEESIEEYEDSLVVMLYYDMFKSSILDGKIKKISRLKLNSYENDILTDDEFKRIKEKVSPLLDILLKEYFILEDNIYNPYGIYSKVRDISRKLGTHTYTKLYEDDNLNDITWEEYNKLPKDIKKKYKWKSYTLHNDELYPWVITDHVARLQKENDKTLHETLSDWSFTYCRKNMSKNWKFNVLNILQQTVYSENKTYSYKNELNWESLKPSLADIDTNKLIAQDHHIILGLFNPYRYASFGKVDGIDLDKSNGKYRSTKILKNRIGIDQIEIPWYFDGTVGDWKEINWQELDNFYKMCNI
jgi:hypothetical protein